MERLPLSAHLPQLGLRRFFIPQGGQGPCAVHPRPYSESSRPLSKRMPARSGFPLRLTVPAAP